MRYCINCQPDKILLWRQSSSSLQPSSSLEPFPASLQTLSSLQAPSWKNSSPQSHSSLTFTSLHFSFTWKGMFFNNSFNLRPHSNLLQRLTSTFNLIKYFTSSWLDAPSAYFNLQPPSNLQPDITPYSNKPFKESPWNPLLAGLAYFASLLSFPRFLHFPLFSAIRPRA